MCQFKFAATFRHCESSHHVFTYILTSRKDDVTSRKQRNALFCSMHTVQIFIRKYSLSMTYPNDYWSKCSEGQNVQPNHSAWNAIPHNAMRLNWPSISKCDRLTGSKIEKKNHVNHYLLLGV